MTESITQTHTEKIDAAARDIMLAKVAAGEWTAVKGEEFYFDLHTALRKHLYNRKETP